MFSHAISGRTNLCMDLCTRVTMEGLLATPVLKTLRHIISVNYVRLSRKAHIILEAIALGV